MSMLFGFLLNRGPEADSAAALYEKIVAQARNPVFYERLGVPDTVDGRFDLIVLHAFLALNRLKQEGAKGKKLAQALFDRLFADMDRSVREMGVGDLSVPRHVKRMMKAFRGRCESYEKALSGTEVDLSQILARNLYGTLENPDKNMVKNIAHYVVRNVGYLQKQSLMEGRAEFVDL